MFGFKKKKDDYIDIEADRFHNELKYHIGNHRTDMHQFRIGYIDKYGEYKYSDDFTSKLRKMLPIQKQYLSMNKNAGVEVRFRSVSGLFLGEKVNIQDNFNRNLQIQMIVNKNQEGVSNVLDGKYDGNKVEGLFGNFDRPCKFCEENVSQMTCISWGELGTLEGLHSNCIHGADIKKGHIITMKVVD